MKSHTALSWEAGSGLSYCVCSVCVCVFMCILIYTWIFSKFCFVMLKGTSFSADSFVKLFGQASKGCYKSKVRRTSRAFARCTYDLTNRFRRISSPDPPENGPLNECVSENCRNSESKSKPQIATAPHRQWQSLKRCPRAETGVSCLIRQSDQYPIPGIFRWWNDHVSIIW